MPQFTFESIEKYLVESFVLLSLVLTLLTFIVIEWVRLREHFGRARGGAPPIRKRQERKPVARRATPAKTGKATGPRPVKAVLRE